MCLGMSGRACPPQDVPIRTWAQLFLSVEARPPGANPKHCHRPHLHPTPHPARPPPSSHRDPSQPCLGLTASLWVLNVKEKGLLHHAPQRGPAGSRGRSQWGGKGGQLAQNSEGASSALVSTRRGLGSRKAGLRSPGPPRMGLPGAGATQTRGLATSLHTGSHHQPSVDVAWQLPIPGASCPPLPHPGARGLQSHRAGPLLSPRWPPLLAEELLLHLLTRRYLLPKKVPTGNAPCRARAVERWGKEGRGWRRQPRALVTGPPLACEPVPAAHPQGTGDGAPRTSSASRHPPQLAAHKA